MSNRTTDSTRNEIKKKIELLPDVTTRPMFGYQCYSVNGKFFAGFGKKDKSEVIIRLSKDLQLEALLKEKHLKIKPFSRGAKMGWVEIDGSNIRIDEAFYWVKKGYEHALNMSKSA
jgi:predicted DNA-binding protein (MmcQ/YjbR family)